MSMPPLPDNSALDQLVLLERERPGLMKELIRLFVADAPKQMRLVCSGYQKRDPEQVRQAAHFLRSGALALGLGELAEQTNIVEAMPLEQFGSDASERLVAGLRSEVHRVLLALLARLREVG